MHIFLGCVWGKALKKKSQSVFLSERMCLEDLAHGLANGMVHVVLDEHGSFTQLFE